MTERASADEDLPVGKLESVSERIEWYLVDMGARWQWHRGARYREVQPGHPHCGSVGVGLLCEYNRGTATIARLSYHGPEPWPTALHGDPARLMCWDCIADVERQANERRNVGRIAGGPLP